MFALEVVRTDDRQDWPIEEQNSEKKMSDTIYGIQAREYSPLAVQAQATGRRAINLPGGSVIVVCKSI